MEKIKNEKVNSPGQMIIHRLKKNKLAMAGLFVLIFMVLLTFIGPLLSPYGINEGSMNMKAAPSAKHWLGTDYLGRDLLTRLMYGGRISITVGFVAVAIQVVIGTLVGSTAGYYGGKIDSILMRITDIFMSLPFLPVVIILGAIMSEYKVGADFRIFSVMLIMGILSWSGLARLIRGEILSLREQEFMQATEALGLRDRRKILRHLIPNIIPTIIVNATLGIGSAILTESALSYLGMGVTEPAASWGNMISAANKLFDFQNRPWLWIPPGICIFLTVIAINLLGDGLRDALDPKMKR